MSPAPKRSDTRGDTCIRVRVRRAYGANGRRGGVLLVIGVQHKDRIESLDLDRAQIYVLVRVAPHHVEEIFRKAAV